MSASASKHWRLVSQALLRPSPWLKHDGRSANRGEDEREDEREAARQKRLDHILGRLDESEWKLVQTCMSEAHLAHVPEELAPLRATSLRTRVVHPLSAEIVGTMDEHAWTSWFAQEDALLDYLEQGLGEASVISDARYRELWYRVMTAKVGAPGSLWLPDHDISSHRALTAALLQSRMDGGTPALVMLHLGPVQGFIASARRIHDLWIGSYTIAYLTLRAAVAIAEYAGPQAVVLPALAHVPAARPLLFSDEKPEKDSRPGALYQRLRRRLRSSLSNKVVAIVSSDQVDAATQRAAQAAQDAWREMAKATRCRIDNAVGDISWGWEGFREQLDAHLEVDAVSQPWPATLQAMRERLERFDIEVPEALAPEHDGGRNPGAAYGALYDLGHRMLAAHRKALAPTWPAGDRRPKCSQCGQREQMGAIEGRPHERRKSLAKLSENLSDHDEQRESLQLTRGEGLCAVCLTKRFAPKCFYEEASAKLGVEVAEAEERRRLMAFPSTYSIASAPFRLRLLQGLAGQRVDDRAALQRTVEAWVVAITNILARDCLDFRPPGNLIPGLSENSASTSPEVLSLDGQWLYESSYQPETAWLDHFPDRARSRDEKEREGFLKTRLPQAFDDYKEMRAQLGAKPSSYYAVLRLDGDSMGKWLTGRHPDMPRLDELAAGAKAEPRPLYPALHGDLSRRLSTLALELHDLVEGIYLGRVVYSGGDDLLAFLPVQTALRCLRAIERKVRSEEYLGRRVTVSAGVAITHVRAPLSWALHEAHNAEDTAKNAAARSRAAGVREHAHLAVHVMARSGAPLRVCLPWRITTETRDTFETLDTLYELLAPRAVDDRDDADPLLRVAVAQRLQAELAELPGAANARPNDPLSELFRNRVFTLLAMNGFPAGVRVGLQALFEKLTPRDMVTLVLLLRFVAREDRGVDAHALCRQLERERSS